MKKLFFFLLFSILIASNSVSAKQEIEINFFYSPSCSACRSEQEFLDKIEKEYPEVKINRYNIADYQGYELVKKICKEYNVERYIGSVPLTFIGSGFFAGFDYSGITAGKMENFIQEQIQQEEGSVTDEQETNKINLPFIGEIDAGEYSLPSLAVVLGFLDGFNICSLGALVLILGMVLVLRSRKRILLFGGLFILTTTIVYGLLIVLWYKLFSFFVPYLRTMEILIGLLGIVGGIYFFRQFIKFKKYGPACEAGTKEGIVTKLSVKVQEAFKKPGNILTLSGIVFLFAIAITVVEFPCSAVVPVAFAGILAKSQLPAFLYLFYIALFVLFYMIDEIIIFLIAVFKMTVWLASGKFVTWIYFLEAIILFLLGFYYFIGF